MSYRIGLSGDHPDDIRVAEEALASSTCDVMIHIEGIVADAFLSIILEVCSRRAEEVVALFPEVHPGNIYRNEETDTVELLFAEGEVDLAEVLKRFQVEPSDVKDLTRPSRWASSTDRIQQLINEY